MRHAKLVGLPVLVGILTLAWAGGGCGRARQVGQAVATARDASDGDFTVKGEKGEELKVDTNGGDEKGGTITVTGQNGEKMTTEIGTSTVTEKDVGIDFYPGATVLASSKMTASGSKSGTYATVSLETKDPLDKVTKLYKDKYAEGNNVVETPESLMVLFAAGENKGKLVEVHADKDKGTTMISIHSGASE